MVDNRSQGFWKYAAAVAVGIMSLHSAVSAGVARPLIVNLDTAGSVVMGKVTQISKINTDSQDAVQMGYAEIDVSKVLKGFQAKTVQMKCPISVSAEYMGAVVVHPVKVGDSGIWVINADGSQNLGVYPAPLPQNRKSEVIKMLKQLDGRKWSEPVNGLRAWAAVVPPGAFGNPVIVFAVQNITESDIYVPVETTPGFITADVKEDSKTSHYELVSNDSVHSRLLCHKLSPKGIIYLHPLYSSIDLGWHQSLPAGKYTVDINCRNSQKTGEYIHFAENEKDIKVWTGTLTAPSVKLNLKPIKTKSLLY